MVGGRIRLSERGSANIIVGDAKFLELLETYVCFTSASVSYESVVTCDDGG